MSVTDELRRLLDERGVEHYDGTETTLWLKDGVGYRASADEGMNGFIQLHLWCTTPEQAIAATLGKQIVRCRDCKHATISTMGVCKYCEMWVLPDVDGYGCDSQVNLPLDFFCAYGKRKEGGDG